jgi:urease accessory protein
LTLKTAPTTTMMAMTINPASDHTLLRLLQLVSPALPVGAYAYSQGMEQAVAAGWLKSSDDLEQWISGLLRHCLARMEVPFFKRFYEAWEQSDPHRLNILIEWYLAGRGTSELLDEERHMGQALQRLLGQLEVLPEDLTKVVTPSFLAFFAGAAQAWQIPTTHGCAGLLWAWVENQVTAAIKLMPLGQTRGQKMLMRAATVISEAVTVGFSLSDEEIGASAPGLVLAGALHETQHTRLFRS